MPIVLKLLVFDFFVALCSSFVPWCNSTEGFLRNCLGNYNELISLLILNLHLQNTMPPHVLIICASVRIIAESIKLKAYGLRTCASIKLLNSVWNTWIQFRSAAKAICYIITLALYLCFFVVSLSYIVLNLLSLSFAGLLFLLFFNFFSASCEALEQSYNSLVIIPCLIHLTHANKQHSLSSHSANSLASHDTNEIPC